MVQGERDGGAQDKSEGMVQGKCGGVFQDRSERVTKWRGQGQV